MLSNEASLGLQDPFCGIWRGQQGWRGQQLELGKMGEEKAAGSQGQVLNPSPTHRNPSQNRKPGSETSRYSLKILKWARDSRLPGKG